MSYLLHTADAVINLAQGGVPNPAPVAPPGLDKFSNQILGWLKWGCGLAAIAGLLAVAIMMGVGVRGRSDTAKNALSHAPWVFGAAALAGSAAGLINSIQ